MSSPDDALSPELLEALRRLAKAPVLLAAFDFDGTLARRGSRDPTGWMSWVPWSPTGTIGQPASRASQATPVLPR